MRREGKEARKWKICKKTREKQNNCALDNYITPKLGNNCEPCVIYVTAVNCAAAVVINCGEIEDLCEVNGGENIYAKGQRTQLCDKW